MVTTDGANDPFVGWVNGYNYTKDVFAAENQIEASQYPLQTKGRSDLNQHEVIWHI